MSMRMRRERQSGMTIIELLVVIAIIGLLSTVVLASLGGARDRAKIAKSQAEINGIEKAMTLMQNDTGLFPHQAAAVCPPVDATDNEVDLSVPAAGLAATDGSFPDWNGPYMDAQIDPWGTPYFFDQDYQCTAGATGCGGVADSGQDSSVIVSCGPNRATTTSNGGACTYDDDNVVFVLCRN